MTGVQTCALPIYISHFFKIKDSLYMEPLEDLLCSELLFADSDNSLLKLAETESHYVNFFQPITTLFRFSELDRKSVV